MSNLKVGVVGVGHIGREHARIYSQLPGVEFVGLYDLDSPCRGESGAAPWRESV